MPLLDWLTWRTVVALTPDPVSVVHVHHRLGEEFKVQLRTCAEEVSHPGEVVVVEIIHMAGAVETPIYREVVVPVGNIAPDLTLTSSVFYFNVNQPHRHRFTVEDAELQRWINVAKPEFEQKLQNRPVRLATVYDIKKCRAAGFAFGVMIMSAVIMALAK